MPNEFGVPTEAESREAARRLFAKDGELEFDDEPAISRVADGCGCYVAAWVWVDDDAALAVLK